MQKFKSYRNKLTHVLKITRRHYYGLKFELARNSEQNRKAYLFEVYKYLKNWEDNKLVSTKILRQRNSKAGLNIV